jgi:hypothetical protein
MVLNKRRFSYIEEAVLKTLAYSDIFDFPLTKQELWRYLISDKDIEKSKFEKALHELINFETFDVFNARKQVITKDGFFCLAGREDNISKRKKNKHEVQKKLVIAEKAAYYLSFIPTIQYIGVSGGVAIGNAGREDDIDFFIITKKNTLFLTRFWILCLLELLNLRRKRNQISAPGKICVNLIIDESKLTWPKDKRDLYIAHEIVQTKTQFVRNDMDKKFFEDNSWVKDFFPNQEKKHATTYHLDQNSYFTLKFVSFFLFLWPFEVLTRNIQKYYMKKHKTTETVSNGLLAFHPNDYRIKTMEVLASKWEKLGLLTNL